MKKWYKKNGLKVLSLFDGISCGAVALEKAGISVGRYSSFEIDYNAVKISKKNYPQMDRHLDVFDGDFTQFKGYDLLIGGSPCTYWSIAQSPDKRETTCEGRGYALFSQFVRALRESECPYFLYENNASMDDTIKEQITKELGVEPMLVNSKLLSAQNRERLYWTNIPVEETPKEKGIIVNRILESDVDDKYFVHDDNITYIQPVDKIRRMNPYQIAYYANGGQGQRVYSAFGKGVTQTANGGGRGAKTGLYYVGEDKVRRLTPLEAERMQTLPDNYTDCDISDNNRYKAIGNGWTVDVIAHFFTGLSNVKPKMPTDDTDKDLDGKDDFEGGVDVLSVFDGMSCGMLAMLDAGQKVNNYYAYEIDEPAVQTSLYNFPQISQQGDVFEADFTEYEGIDYLVGGSPCTYWSIAQSPDKRETTASGLGWDLFCQYVRALKEAKPKFFIYENNKSMSNDIRQSITETFGFEPICINSALVSAQNRQRLYWVGKRNEDGTYSKVDVQQPEDRGILLKDVINKSHRDLTNNEKAYCLTASYEGAAAYNTIERGQRSMIAEPVAVSFVGDRDKRKIGTMDKAYCVATSPCSDSLKGIAEPVNVTENGKSQTVKSQYEKNGVPNFVKYTSTYGASGVAEPICLNPRTNGVEPSSGDRIYDTQGKGTAVTSGWHTKIAESVCGRIPQYGKDDKSRPVIASYSNKGDSEGCLKGDAFPENPNKQVNDYVAEPISEKAFCMVGDRDDRKAGTSDKAYCLCAAPTSDMTPKAIIRVGGLYDQVTRWGIYDQKGNAPTLTASMGMGGGHIPMIPEQVKEESQTVIKGVEKTFDKYGYVPEMFNAYNATEITDKSPSLTTGSMETSSCAVNLFCSAVPTEFDKNGIPIKAVSVTDGKEHTVYEVKDKKITIKGKQYDIKLEDGYYIIRKLTVEECKELQTVPQWYDFSCTSVSQAYKMLGNGWTVKVISHLIKATME